MSCYFQNLVDTMKSASNTITLKQFLIAYSFQLMVSVLNKDIATLLHMMCQLRQRLCVTGLSSAAKRVAW